MNKHILIGKGRIIHKSHILHYSLNNKSHSVTHPHIMGRGTPAHKKEYEIGEGISKMNISHKSHIKPLKFKF